MREGRAEESATAKGAYAHARGQPPLIREPLYQVRDLRCSGIWVGGETQSKVKKNQEVDERKACNITITITRSRSEPDPDPEPEPETKKYKIRTKFV